MARAVSCCVAAALLALALASPASAAIKLVPIVTGLSSPVYVTHAGDSSRRLFIVEQQGTIRVFHAGRSTAPVFLDVQEKVLAGGERGLLGLAFHPLYFVNGRFFIYYTRRPDGAIVIAEYQVTADPDSASRTEKVLLTIPHPVNANHNGGMLSFGPGGYLYIGVGDGGSGNDPPNNAQNTEVLLGKILRLNVDQADTAAGTPYSTPPSNPFVGKAGRDEIFAYGLRNPWRFSFDRRTGQQWVGDVGEARFEEVDTPITPGGNYGWRVYEGGNCTNNDPQLCTGRFLSPVFDYPHTGARCSVTGGYVYRGPAGALPDGTYIYADYCSGEIFGWDGRSQRLLLNAGGLLSSFGEDQDGEIYVVSLGGTVSQIVEACTSTLSPDVQEFTSAGGPASFSIQNLAECEWTATSRASWISITGISNGSGNGTIRYTVEPYKGHAITRTGRITIGDQVFLVRQSR